MMVPSQVPDTVLCAGSLRQAERSAVEHGYRTGTLDTQKRRCASSTSERVSTVKNAMIVWAASLERGHELSILNARVDLAIYIENKSFKVAPHGAKCAIQ